VSSLKTSRMPEAICNTSPLIVLERIGSLPLLEALYGHVLITPEIEKEFGQPLPGYVVVRAVKNSGCSRILETILDPGEASAIALALETTEESLLILDDLKARKIARKSGIRLTGTLGVLLAAKSRKILPSVAPFLERLKSQGFWISEELQSEVLRLAEEL